LSDAKPGGGDVVDGEPAPSDSAYPESQRACLDEPVLATSVSLDEKLPELGLSVNELLQAGFDARLDEMKHVPYNGQRGWVPDQVESVECGAGALRITALPSSTAAAVVYSKPTERCATSITLQVRIEATSTDGAVAETMNGDLTLAFHEAGAERPSYVHFFAEQYVEDMKGTAQPPPQTKDRPLKEGEDPSALHPTFRIESANLDGSLAAPTGSTPAPRSRCRHLAPAARLPRPRPKRRPPVRHCEPEAAELQPSLAVLSALLSPAGRRRGLASQLNVRRIQVGRILVHDALIRTPRFIRPAGVPVDVGKGDERWHVVLVRPQRLLEASFGGSIGTTQQLDLAQTRDRFAVVRSRRQHLAVQAFCFEQPVAALLSACPLDERAQV